MILAFKGLPWLLCGEGTTGHQSENREEAMEMVPQEMMVATQG